MRIDLYNKIDDYILNRLSIQDRNKFEKAVLIDNSLRKEFKFRLALKRVIDTREENRLRQNLMKLNQIMKPFNKFSMNVARYRNFLIITSIAASFSLLIIAYFQIQLANKNYQYLSSYYSAPNNYYFPTLRSAKIEQKHSETVDGMYAYETQKYDIALEKLQSALEKDENNQNLMFYLGSTHLMLKNLPEAKELFLKLKDAGNKFYEKYIDWSLCLIYLEIGETENAKTVLKKIVESDNNFSENALKLLSQIEDTTGND